MFPTFISMGERKETTPINITIEPDNKNELDIPMFSANVRVHSKPIIEGKTAEL